jgi:hypothetical protein
MAPQLNGPPTRGVHLPPSGSVIASGFDPESVMVEPSEEERPSDAFAPSVDPSAMLASLPAADPSVESPAVSSVLHAAKPPKNPSEMRLATNSARLRILPSCVGSFIRAALGIH